MRKKKVDTHSDDKFPCPTTGCTSHIIRYRTLFEHFGLNCEPEGWERFQFWCDLCDIPRFWLKGTDLVRHKQNYHDLDDFPAMLSWKAVPEGFSVHELLEFNVKDMGFKKQKLNWAKEVEEYKKTHNHKVFFKHPTRNPKESVRKMKVTSRKSDREILAGGSDVPVDLSVASTVGVSPDVMIVQRRTFMS